MTAHHVVLHVGSDDDYAPASAPENTLFFRLTGRGRDPECEIQEGHLYRHPGNDREVGLSDLGLRAPQTALDLYRISAAAYVADLRLSRRRIGYDQWTREIVLHVPVADVGLWSPQVQTLNDILSFLSGDQWSIKLRHRKVSAGNPTAQMTTELKLREAMLGRLNGVCLLSGGLDSFIGAADALALGHNLLLISHVPQGVARWLTPAQRQLRTGLAEAYPSRRIEHIRVTLNPPHAMEHSEKEHTQRVRSILFFGLGTLAAAAIGESTPMIIPENGFISLNVPLTPGRIGSVSTRTTHPNTIYLYQRLLDGLSIDVPLEVPYMFRTKGDMLAKTKSPEVVRRLAEVSVSCASPNPRSAAREEHCGHCVPCIVRRAAMTAVGLDRADAYRVDIRNPEGNLTKNRATHLRAFGLAIRRRRGGISLVDLLSAGNLPASIGTPKEFREVHDRGLAEVATFLRYVR